MKNIKYLVLLLAFQSLKAANIETYTISEAVSKKLVDASIYHNSKSVHYINPLIIDVKNKTSKSFYLKFSSGDLYIPDDSSYQNIILTENLLVLVDAGKRKAIKPKGMCTEPNDRAGNDGLTYFFKENKNKKLVEIAKFIAENKYNDAVGQQAVWCVADKTKDILDINGYDSLSRLKLMKTVAAITGKRIPDMKKLRETFNNYTLPQKKETIGGMFEFSFPVSKKIHIAMFNPSGTLVRELYYNTGETPGVHKINFEFDYTVYTDEYYTIKLIADDEVILASKVDGVK